MIVSGENVKKLFSQSNLTPAVLMKVRSNFSNFSVDLRTCQFQTKKLFGEKRIFQSAQDDRHLSRIRNTNPMGGVDRLSQN
jgi:hypothetical protein